MAPISAKAKQASMVITPPMAHMERNNNGERVFPAISLAVRKIPEPMIPLARSRMESSKESSRTSLESLAKIGCRSLDCGGLDISLFGGMASRAEKHHR